jgi:hypothetical protein
VSLPASWERREFSKATIVAGLTPGFCEMSNITLCWSSSSSIRALYSSSFIISSMHSPVSSGVAGGFPSSRGVGQRGVG